MLLYTGVMFIMFGASSNAYTLTQNPYGSDTWAGKFIIVVDTTKEWKTNNNQFEIPTEWTWYNYTVEWWDGQSDTWVIWDKTHTYGTPWIYEIRISGDFPRIYFYHGEGRKLLDIKQWWDINK